MKVKDNINNILKMHELYKTEEEIKKWLDENQVSNYKLIVDKKYGYIVDVDNNVDLSDRKIDKIIVKFNNINGDFFCSENNLISLYGCPKKIIGDFSASRNKLKNLKYCPEIVGASFFAMNNEIESLEYLPKKIGKLSFIIIRKNDKLKDIQYIKTLNELKKIQQFEKMDKSLDDNNNHINTLKNKI